MQEQDDASQSAKDVSLEVETQTASAELQEAAVIVNQHVNRLANCVQHQLTPEDRSATLSKLYAWLMLSCVLHCWCRSRICSATDIWLLQSFDDAKRLIEAQLKLSELHHSTGNSGKVHMHYATCTQMARKVSDHMQVMFWLFAVSQRRASAKLPA